MGVQVFTRGHEVRGTWERTEENPVWTLTTLSGEPIPLAPGPTWILLAANNDSVFASATVNVFSPSEASTILGKARAEAASAAAADEG